MRFQAKIYHAQRRTRKCREINSRARVSIFWTPITSAGPQVSDFFSSTAIKMELGRRAVIEVERSFWLSLEKV